ncbi:MAG: methyltransferase [Lutibacter sp.]|nr:MAG: methyltransferase [Lutibacter sp.]
MSIKKTIKKGISFFIPKGILKEEIKLKFYNLFSPKFVKFEIVKENTLKIIYKTIYNDLCFFTEQALYSIVPDFDYYQFFYKVKENDVIIDGGANVGILSMLFMKKTKAKGYVYCFEPDRLNINMMKSNFVLNKDLYKNYDIIDSLMWSKNELIDFQESGTVASSALWFSDDIDIVKKQAISLDEWSEDMKLEKIDFIKMDIEGAELEAIKGCKEIIEKFQPNFAIASYHMVNGELTYIKLEEFFKEINYPFVTKKFRGNEIITFAGPAVLI